LLLPIFVRLLLVHALRPVNLRCMLMARMRLFVACTLVAAVQLLPGRGNVTVELLLPRVLSEPAPRVPSEPARSVREESGTFLPNESVSPGWDRESGSPVVRDCESGSPGG